MIVFSVISLTPSDALGEKIQAEYKANSLKLSATNWLIAADGTAKEVCDRLSISEGEIGVSAVVFATAGYFGRAPTNIWEWIKVKREAPNA